MGMTLLDVMTEELGGGVASTWVVLGTTGVGFVRLALMVAMVLHRFGLHLRHWGAPTHNPQSPPCGVVHRRRTPGGPPDEISLPEEPAL